VISDVDVDRFYALVVEKIGSASTWPKWREGWCDRADLALLDAVYSTRQRYETTVLPRVKKWESRFSTSRHSNLEYLAEIDEFEIRKVFGGNVLPGVKIPGLRTGRKKSEGVKEIAQRLCSPEIGLKSAQQIRDAVSKDGLDHVEYLLQKTKGVGPATSRYFLMLIGVDGVKVDTLLGSWVQEQMGNINMKSEEITELVSRVAIERFGRRATDLDYAIWNYESNNRPRGKRKS
jgi:hypothetical protein